MTKILRVEPITSPSGRLHAEQILSAASTATKVLRVEILSAASTTTKILRVEPITSPSDRLHAEEILSAASDRRNGCLPLPFGPDVTVNGEDIGS